MTRTTFVAMALLIVTGLPARAADDPVDEAKRLYLSAAYDAALAALTNLPPSVDLDEVDKYRALCLLGLNRPQDAQETIQRLVTRRPLAKLDDSDSPKLLTMFKEARARVLPTAARNLYVSAKDNFEKGQVKTAAGQFHDVLALVAETDAVERCRARRCQNSRGGFLETGRAAARARGCGIEQGRGGCRRRASAGTRAGRASAGLRCGGDRCRPASRDNPGDARVESADGAAVEELHRNA